MILALLFACEPDDVDTGDSAPVEETEYPDTLECNTLELRADKEDPPHVGEDWTIFLFCDDVLLTGASKVGLDPTDAATVNENVLTWAKPGDATITLQTGRFKTERDVSVLPPE
jgi:hypothetical protein